MAQMNISNTLWNDTSKGEIAYAEQLKDKQVDWDDTSQIYNKEVNGEAIVPEELRNEVGKFQSKLNHLFLSHYAEFQLFLKDKGVDGVIDTWKDVEDFLTNISDSEVTTLVKMMASLQMEFGHLNIRLNNVTGQMEAVSTQETFGIDTSYIDPQTGTINLIYTFE